MPAKPDPTQETYDTYAALIADRFWETKLPLAWDAFCARLPKGAIVADLGCGAGRDTRQFTGRGFWTAGLDYSFGMLVQASQRAPAPYTQGDLRSLPFADAVLDAAWVNASLLHIPRAQAPGVLAEVRRALKPGGVLYLSLKEGEGEKWERREGDRFFTFFRVEEIHALLADAGFGLLEEWIDHTSKVTWINLLARAG
jgi:ubiquinone/menaquinone biosynthesis C-methylase UbiE